MVKSQYPGISGKKMISLLIKHYQATVVSQRWSHIKISLPSAIKTIVPDHKALDYGTFNGILKQLNISEIQFLKLL